MVLVHGVYRFDRALALTVEWTVGAHYVTLPEQGKHIWRLEHITHGQLLGNVNSLYTKLSATNACLAVIVTGADGCHTGIWEMEAAVMKQKLSSTSTCMLFTPNWKSGYFSWKHGKSLRILVVPTAIYCLMLTNHNNTSWKNTPVLHPSWGCVCQPLQVRNNICPGELDGWTHVLRCCWR